MKNIMIIGANGFTGRQILNDLSSKAQYKVTGCSLHPDILPKNGGNYHFITTDIRDEAAVKQLFKDVQPDVVINCSALSVPDYCRNASRRSLANKCYSSRTIGTSLRKLQKPVHSFIYRLRLWRKDRREVRTTLYRRKSSRSCQLLRFHQMERRRESGWNL